MNLQQWLKDKGDYKLCYIKNNFAYFTNLPLSEQWGDDWNDSPYEHNAGEPSYESENQIIKIAYDGYDTETPADKSGYNSSYSVEMINSGAVAWLTGYDYKEEKYISLLAGSTIEEFADKLNKIGEKIYIPI